MEATATGPNRTGAALHPKDIEQMLDAVDELSPPVPINTLQMDVERQSYITEAEAVGSIPPSPQTAKVSAKKAAESPAIALLMDKLGERIAFERTGTRLYGALIAKHLALLNAGQQIPSAATDEAAGDTLQRIRSEELGHFQLLCAAVMEMGGDPTAQTPCADVIGTASAGLMQVITDPRTTFAQSLNAILTAELTDNAGWEMLITLAEAAGQPQMVEQFAQALEAEQQHLLIVRGWLDTLMETEIGTPAV
jgi:hypothetical protein